MKKTIPLLLLLAGTAYANPDWQVGDVAFAWDAIDNPDAQYRVYCKGEIVWEGPETTTGKLKLKNGWNTCTARAFIDYGEGAVLESGDSNALRFPFLSEAPGVPSGFAAVE